MLAVKLDISAILSIMMMKVLARTLRWAVHGKIAHSRSLQTFFLPA